MMTGCFTPHDGGVTALSQSVMSAILAQLLLAGEQPFRAGGCPA